MDNATTSTNDANNAIDLIRAALAPAATAEQRTTAATLCRALASQLAPVTPTAHAHVTPESVARLVGLLGGLRNVPTTQVLDVVIAKLRAALPEGAIVPAPDVGFRMPSGPVATFRHAPHGVAAPQAGAPEGSAES